jgi:hypothetical protein
LVLGHPAAAPLRPRPPSERETPPSEAG